MSRLDPDSQSGNPSEDSARSTSGDVQARKHHASWRWPLAIVLGLLGGSAVAALVWWLVPVRYEAFALLKVARRPPAVLGRAADTDDDFAVFKRTQAERIRSGVVMQGTLRDGQINRLSMVRAHGDDPIAWLSNELIVDYPNDTEILRIAMKGTPPAEVAKIVNKIVETYLKEVVQHEKELRNAERTQLERTQQVRTRELAAEMDALHKLEQVQGASSSESVQLQKKMIADQLADLMAERRELVRSLRQNKLQTMLAEAREEKALAPAATEAASASKDPALMTLPLLEKEKEFLESTLQEVEHGVAEKAAELQKMEKFSAEVASKREKLGQQQRIVNQIGERLNLIGVESLAQDRITKLDDAYAPAGGGDAIRIRAGAALAGVLSFGLIMVVVAVTVGRGKSSKV